MKFQALNTAYNPITLKNTASFRNTTAQSSRDESQYMDQSAIIIPLVVYIETNPRKVSCDKQGI